VAKGLLKRLPPTDQPINRNTTHKLACIMLSVMSQEPRIIFFICLDGLSATFFIFPLKIFFCVRASVSTREIAIATVRCRAHEKAAQRHLTQAAGKSIPRRFIAANAPCSAYRTGMRCAGSCDKAAIKLPIEIASSTWHEEIHFANCSTC
jgi:hypothetical protein